MKEIVSLLKQGQLNNAIERCTSILQDEPMNFDVRGLFAELLCINGELERADKQLDFMVQKNPEFAIGAVNLRHLIRAQQARLDFYQGKGIPQLFHEADELDKVYLASHLSRVEKNYEEAAEKVTKIDEHIQSLKKDDLPRDLDDSLNYYVEVLGTNGEFYLARFDEIIQLEVLPAESYLETIWLRVNIEITDGPSGIAHIPAVYAHSSLDVEKLAQVTEWDELKTDFNLGKGMKMLFIDDEARPITELNITREVAAEV